MHYILFRTKHSILCYVSKIKLVSQPTALTEVKSTSLHAKRCLIQIQIQDLIIDSALPTKQT